MAHAAESTHWYGRNGEPCYTIIGKNGKERNTTLRDARVHGYVPSVTTVMGIMAKPGLERWKQDQILMAALTLPEIEGESLDDFKRRAYEDGQQHAKDAAALGTAIHASLQSAYEGESYDPEHEQYVVPTMRAIEEEFGSRAWIAETAFCSDLGYGGKVDLSCRDAVLDFKTKEFGPDDKFKPYDEQITQLDAYRHGLGIPKAQLANVYISVSHPGVVRIVHHTEGNHFERFNHMLSLWKLTKNYDPVEYQQ